MPAAATDLRPLRRTSRAELGLAAAALGAAALLGSLAPPVSGQPGGAIAGLSASGADFATTTRVKLTAASDQPGPNRFVARVEDYDSSEPVPAREVRLRFTPLDDPGVTPTSLALRPGADGSYRPPARTFVRRPLAVTALVQRGGDAVEVPLELDVRGPKQFVSVQRVPGRAPEYELQVGKFGSLGYIALSPHPERAGRAGST